MHHASTTIRSTHDIGHIVGSAVIDGDGLVLRLDLDEHDELPIAAELALELLRAAGDCETSDEPTTRQAAREHLTALMGLIGELQGRLTEADLAATP